MNSFNFAFNEAIRFWVEGAESYVINALGVQKFGKGSDKKGGPLLEKNHLGVPYWEKRSCNCWIRLPEVLE